MVGEGEVLSKSYSPGGHFQGPVQWKLYHPELYQGLRAQYNGNSITQSFTGALEEEGEARDSCRTFLLLLLLRQEWPTPLPLTLLGKS